MKSATTGISEGENIVFGKNPLQKQDLNDGRTLRVVKDSPFFTLQGEGPFSGHPAVFIRLHGCNLRCWFCDTQFSDPEDPNWQMIRLARVAYDEAKFPKTHGPANLIVITGGEPFVQNIYPLCNELLKMGMTVQIETAGSLWVEGMEDLFGAVNGHRMNMVVSPKTPQIHDMIRKYATAFKYVIGSDTQVQGPAFLASTQIKDGTPRPLASAREGCPIYLSPMDEYSPLVNEMNRAKVSELCLRHGYIAGVQLHKLLAISEPA